MESLSHIQVNASALLQESEEQINSFIEVFLNAFGNSAVMRKTIEQFKRTCISHGRIESLLKYTLKDDTEDTKEEDKKP